jgi:hypothetical protein
VHGRGGHAGFADGLERRRFSDVLIFLAGTSGNINPATIVLDAEGMTLTFENRYS